MIHSHQSGLWNISKPEFKHAVITLQLKSDLLSWTEVNDNDLQEALIGNPDFGTARYLDNEKGECAVQWDRAGYEFNSKRYFPLTTMTVTTDTGFERPPVGLIAAYLKDRSTKRPVILGALHMVSGVEEDLRAHWPIRSLRTEPGMSHRAQAWLSAARGLRRRIRIMKFFHPKAQIIIGCDTNLNLNVDWCRELVLQIGLPLARPKRTLPTHTSRAIDTSFIRGLGLIRIKVWERFPGFDHNAVTETLEDK